MTEARLPVRQTFTFYFRSSLGILQSRQTGLLNDGVSVGDPSPDPYKEPVIQREERLIDPLRKSTALWGIHHGC